VQAGSTSRCWLDIYSHAVIGKADVGRLHFAVVVVAAVPVLLKVNEQNLLGLDHGCQFEGFLKGIESCPGAVIGWVSETVLQTALKHARLDDKEVGRSDFGSMCRERFQVTGGIHDPSACFNEDVHKSGLFTAVHRYGVYAHGAHLKATAEGLKTDEAPALIGINQRAVLRSYLR